MVERTGTERPLTMSVGQTRNACRDLLHDRHGELADKRDRHGVRVDPGTRRSGVSRNEAMREHVVDVCLGR